MQAVKFYASLIAGSLLATLFLMQCLYEPARQRMEREFPYHATTTTVEPVQPWATHEKEQ